MKRQASWSCPPGGEGTTEVTVQEVLRTNPAAELTVQHLFDLVAACARRNVDRGSLVEVAAGAEGGWVLQVTAGGPAE